MIGATLCLVPIVFYWAAVAVQNNVNRVEDWLPKTFEETKHLAWFRKHFASDQFVIVSWQGCRLDVGQVTNDDPKSCERRRRSPPARLARLLIPEKNLGKPEGFALAANFQDLSTLAEGVSPEDAATCEKYFKSVLTGRDLLNRLTAPPLSLSAEAAVKRLQGTMIGPDGEQTCLVVTLRCGTERIKASARHRKKSHLSRRRATGNSATHDCQSGYHSRRSSLGGPTRRQQRNRRRRRTNIGAIGWAVWAARFRTGMVVTAQHTSDAHRILLWSADAPPLLWLSLAFQDKTSMPF